jgi:hypothetical protein
VGCQHYSILYCIMGLFAGLFSLMYWEIFMGFIAIFLNVSGVE